MDFIMEAWEIEGMERSLSLALSGLTVQSAKGVVRFDRPAPVRHLATATLRGLAGHLLTKVAPELTKIYFKPGQGNHLPPAYLFQPLFDRSGAEIGFPFRIVTWDRPGKLLPAFMEGLGRANGCPFADSGAAIRGIEFASPEEIRFPGIRNIGPVQKLYLHTPVRLKKGKKTGWISEKEITLGHIIKASVNRINTLSESYGNGEKLDPLPYMAEASLARELTRNLRWVSPRRRSTSQGKNIALSGVIGAMHIQGISSTLVSLLSSIAAFHIGKHTAEGCGYIICSQS